MSILLQKPTEFALKAVRARQAHDAGHRAEGDEMAELLIETSADGREPWLKYPHVFLWLHVEDKPFKLEPYAWQFIYGSLEHPIVLEAPDSDRGEDADPWRSVATVYGARLRQTVRAVVEAIARFSDTRQVYTPKVLHLRTIALRAVIMDAGNWDDSIAIPIAPVPPELAGRTEWPLMEFVEVIRGMLDPRAQDPQFPTMLRAVENSLLALADDTDDSLVQKAITNNISGEAMSYSFNPLDYISFVIAGGLTPLYIGPAPDINDIIQSEAIFINASLPGLGIPAKPDIGGPGGGQYIEIIVDDAPPSSRITTAVPYMLTLTPGTHMLHFMLSSGDGECIKNGGNCFSKVVHIKAKSLPTLVDSGPIIIYNMPRAVHRASNVILDFGLVNVPIGGAPPGTPVTRRWMRDHQINVYIDGQLADVLNYWNPYEIVGLAPAPSYSIELRLRIRNGAELTDPYTRTNPRNFEVR
ncbi:MAG: hypothetical protein JWQ98_358 [Chlorobi bacterium]|nr:hypothetical protein [Chlorobiota bacterium]